MRASKHNILIFGSQGSGKGTQGQMLSEALSIPHISTGTIFRQLKNDNSKPARKVTSILESGQLVPDKITNEVIKERLEKNDCQAGFILDGYPRNITQADFLKNNFDITHVIVINLPDDAGVNRISKRRVCANGHSYHPEYAPPKTDSKCDIDALPLFQRDDDKEEAIKKRLSIYHRETKPIIALYRESGLNIVEINGRPAIDEVTKEIKAKLKIYS